MSRWSASMFVTTATVGDSARNERSYSSASTTYSRSPPARRFPSHAATRPPTSAVGSRPAAASAVAVITVVVVLPCVPAIADQLAPGGDFAERLGAANHWNAELARANELRMILRHRRRDDERARAVDVRRIVRL